MELLEEDLNELNFLYENILILLKEKFILNNTLNLKNALEFISCFYSKLLIFNNTNKEPPFISNLPSNGILSICGYQRCRIANKFLYDFLNKLNLNPTLQYIYTDENNVWHIVSPINANHLIVAINFNNQTYYLDLYNEFYFDSNFKLIELDNKNIDIDDLLQHKYFQQIMEIISIYAKNAELGIKHIYSYK